MITRERLMELLEYDPVTGVFTWKVGRSGTVKAGSVAGHVMRSGYRRIEIDGQHFLAHRLAWLYVYGEFPEIEIDHINGIRGDNRIANLRDVTKSENKWNSSAAQVNSKSKIRGVWLEKGKYWRARLKVRGKEIHLGMFSNPDDARAAYLAAKQIHHPTSAQQLKETK